MGDEIVLQLIVMTNDQWGPKYALTVQLVIYSNDNTCSYSFTLQSSLTSNRRTIERFEMFSLRVY